MKFGSLFSGIGGFDLGLERAGLECAWQVEIDKDCQRVLAKHFPSTERLEDVSTVGRLSAVDVICGGFPCQDLSVAGKRKGLAGERSGLWFEFLRIIESNLPRWIVIENVPGLLSSDEGRDFAAILRGLVECGYCLAWRIFDAQYDGVAQRRRRVFIVGSLGDGSCAEILFESESVSWNPPTRREAGAGVTPILEAGARTNSDGYRDGDGIGVEGDPMFTLQSGKQHAVAATLDQRGRGPTDAVMMNLQVSGAVSSKWAKGTGGPAGDEAYNLVTHALSSEGADASEDGTGRGTPLIVANCFNGYTGGPDDNDAQGRHLVATAYRTAGNCGPFEQGDKTGALNTATDPSQNIIAFTERTRSEGRNFESQEELAYAITNPGSGGRTHSRQIAGGFGVRRLTPRECERLQGFPDDWTLYDAEGKEISDSARYRMLGNAVCVNVAKWIGKRIVDVGEKEILNGRINHEA